MYTNSEMCSTVKFVACLLVWNCCCVWMQCVADRHAQTSGCLIRGLMKEVIDEVGHEIEEKERERDDVRLSASSLICALSNRIVLQTMVDLCEEASETHLSHVMRDTVSLLFP